MKHIIMRFTCWLWVGSCSFWGWLCTARGGGVGTGLGVGVGFGDWEVPPTFLRLLVWPLSFLKVSTAWVGRNRQTETCQSISILRLNTMKSFWSEPNKEIKHKPIYLILSIPLQLWHQYILSIHLSIYLSEKFIAYQGIRWDVWLATSGADVFVWIQ